MAHCRKQDPLENRILHKEILLHHDRLHHRILQQALERFPPRFAHLVQRETHSKTRVRQHTNALVARLAHDGHTQGERQAVHSASASVTPRRRQQLEDNCGSEGRRCRHERTNANE